MTSLAAADLKLMQGSMLLEGDPAAAARHAGEVLEQFPHHEAAALLMAAARRRLGDGPAALAVLEPLVMANPESAVLNLELARCLSALGQSPAAMDRLLRATQLNPNLAEAWQELSRLYFASGDELGGDKAYLACSRLRRDPPELTDALVALNAGRWDTAEQLARRRLLQVPLDGDTWYLLATVAQRRGDQIAAEELLEKCLALLPGHPGARYDLAKLLQEQERNVEALRHIRRLRAQDPRSIAHCLLEVKALRQSDRRSEARVLLERLIEEQPSGEILVVYGNLQRELGNQSEAITAYRRALEVQPGYAEAYWALANLKTFKLGDDDISGIDRQLRLPEHAQDAGLHFALGKALEDRREFARAFEHYQKGNALKRATLSYDPAAARIYAERSKTLCTREFFAARATFGSQRRDPIFIVGLPRSGSTLLEQMLASHPAIEGTHELPDIGLLAERLAARSDLDKSVEYPKRLALLPAAEFEALAQSYLSRTERVRPGARAFFVDKMLGNFGHLALIHLMFPRSLIIDARRHPMACAFSCYKQHFSTAMDFSFELRELGEYYRGYADLMQQFDAVLPGRVHRVYYERLVAKPREELERVLARLQLPFDEACLKFYENPRIVQTISSEQVRRPLYADALEQWRNFAAWLQPLELELKDLIADYPRWD